MYPYNLVRKQVRAAFYTGLVIGALAGGLLASGTARADSLIINGVSIHMGGGDFNELNYGMGFIHDLGHEHAPLGADYVHGGFYRNSYRDLSTYAALGYDIYSFSRHVKLKAELGLVTGYELMPVAPMLVPVLSIDKVRVLALLPGCAACVGAIGFQLQVPLK